MRENRKQNTLFESDMIDVQLNACWTVGDCSRGPSCCRSRIGIVLAKSDQSLGELCTLTCHSREEVLEIAVNCTERARQLQPSLES